MNKLLQYGIGLTVSALSFLPAKSVAQTSSVFDTMGKEQKQAIREAFEEVMLQEKMLTMSKQLAGQISANGQDIQFETVDRDVVTTQQKLVTTHPQENGQPALFLLMIDQKKQMLYGVLQSPGKKDQHCEFGTAKELNVPNKAILKAALQVKTTPR